MLLKRIAVALLVGLPACTQGALPAATPPAATPPALAPHAAAQPAASAAAAPATADAGSPSPPEHSHVCGSAHHRFKNAAKWAKIFDDPSRDEWQKPAAVIQALALSPDARVVDIGAGTGYFTVRLARAVPRGKVVAVDIEPTLLQYIDHRAQKEHLGNVSTALGNAKSPNVKGPIDLALVVDTYHHIEDRPAYFHGVLHELSPHGRVVIVDFRMGKLPVGPPEKHRIPPEQTTREMKQAGYKKCGSYDKLPYQYVLEFGLRCQAG